MITKEIVQKLNLKPLASKALENITVEITGCYISDLLSLAMSRINEGNVWITVQTNINIVAVAALTDAACIIIPENISVDDSVLNKANEEGILVLSSDKRAYELAMELSKFI